MKHVHFKYNTKEPIKSSKCHMCKYRSIANKYRPMYCCIKCGRDICLLCKGTCE